MRLLIAFLLFSISSHAQLSQKDKLDSLFNRLERAGNFMGSVALYMDGKPVYERAVGFKDTVKGQKADVHTRYRIGSITKTFTAVLLMKAVEAGKLSLDDKLSNWYPQVQKADSITIRQLMGHRSGIANFTDAKDYMMWNTKQHSAEQILDKIIKGGSRFSPGEKFEYSNSGYYLLGLILEKMYKRSYRELLERQILRPLKLTETGIGGKIDLSKNECRSFLFTGIWLRSPETDMSVPFSAGNIVSTPRDVCRFAAALFEGRLLTERSIQEMQTFKDNVGLGLFRIPFGERQGVGHTGGIDGFSTVYGYFPDGKVCFALFSNGSNYNNNDISIALLSAAYGVEVKVPDFSVKILTDADLTPYLGVYSTKQLPLKITFTAKNGRLVSQATGQKSFEMDALGDHVFTKDQYGIRVTFDPSGRRMMLKQGGATLLFEKE